MRVTDVADNLAHPSDRGWDRIEREAVRLAPVPLDAQPNAYIRAAWADRAYGLVPEVAVAAARRNGRLFIRLEWSATGPGSNGSFPEFADAAGVFFGHSSDGSGDPDRSPATIGTRESPVTLWFWRDLLSMQQSLPAAKTLVASGPGVFRPTPDEVNGDAADISAEAVQDGPRWTVVISGDADTAASSKMGVVVWDGANDERSGIGAVTHQWVSLDAG